MRLGAYEGVLADCLRAVKFERWEAMGRTLGEHLGRAVRDARSNRTIGFVVRSSFRLRCLSVDVWFEESTIHAVSPGPWEKCSVARFCNRFVSPLVAAIRAYRGSASPPPESISSASAREQGFVSFHRAGR